MPFRERTMELRHLRYLIAVGEQSTFVKAAESLRLAQPALSRQIQSLERELNAPLLVRGRRAVSLTTAGAICLGVARSITARMDASIERARMADAGRIGSCTIYVSVWALWTGFSARLISYLRETEPGIVISFEEAGTGGHWGTVDSRVADIAISTKPTPDFVDLTSESLIDDIVDTAILPTTHRLADRDSISLEELRDETFLLYEPNVVNYVDHDLEAAFARARFTPQSRKLARSSEALLAMVAAGMGWSVHRRTLRDRIPGVATVPIENFVLPFPVALVWRKDETRRVIFTVMKRIHELTAAEYPELYAPSAEKNRKPGGEAHRQRRSHGVEFRHLRYFSAAVEEPSIGRAALRLGISQPALSRQLKDLEREIGVELLTRSHRGVVPTPAGEAFYRDAQAILDEVSRLPSELARGERAISGKCNIAAIPSIEVRDLTSSLLAEGAARFPDIAFYIQNIATPLQPAEVRNGAFDIGLCHAFPGLVAEYPDVDCRELMPDVIDCALVSANSPLAARKEVELQDLADLPFLFFRREFHPAFHDYLSEQFRKRGFEPLLGAMQEGLQTMWALTAAGEGWSLGFSGQRSKPPPGVVAVPITDFQIPWGVVMLTRRSESRPSILAVIDLLERVAANRKELSLKDAKRR